MVGAGQAGLAVSHALTAAGVEHVVLERGRVGQAWRDRWDSFTLVGPNWTMRLPDGAYTGADPEAFAPRDEVVGYLEGYAGVHAGPVREGVTVDRLERSGDGRFRLSTDDGTMAADAVVVCSGAYQRQHRPAFAAGFGPDVALVDSSRYRRPDDLPPGGVLVVGSGQTGVQLAEELCLAGRDVTLACGRAPWAPRRPGGRDIFDWLEDAGFFDQTAAALPDPTARLLANVQATGARGGHDLHYRVLRDLGVTLAGRVADVRGGTVTFADDLAASVAYGDARMADLMRLIREALGVDLADGAAPEPFVADAPQTLDASTLGAVVFSTGYRPGYADWIPFDVFDAHGFPVTVDEGLRTAVPGLYFCGVHWLRNRRSSLLWGVGDDARIVADSIAADRR